MVLFLVKVSVIVPVYNVEKYLRECLENILNQSLEDLEVICVNDGSTDGSLDILNEFKEKDKRVKVFSQKNQGLSGARNTGMRNVTGKYVTFIDSDDYFTPGCLEELYNICEEKELDVVISKLLNFDEDTGETLKSDYHDIKFLKKLVGDKVFDYTDLGEKLYNIPVTAPGKFYRYDLISDIEFPRGVIFEDNLFFTEVLFRAERIYFHDEYIYNRRVRMDSITTSNFSKFHDSIFILNNIISITKRHGHYEEFKFKLFRHKVKKIRNRFLQVPEEYKHDFFTKIKKDFTQYDLDLRKDDDYPEKFDGKTKYILYSAINSDNWEEFEQKVRKREFRDELYISYLFSPSDFVSGITVAKRIAESGNLVDVLQVKSQNSIGKEFNNRIGEYIHDRIVLDVDCEADSPECIFKFINDGLKAIKHDYKRIYSRSWYMSNHLLACEYKFRNPDVFWTAEFSDPLMYDMSNQLKNSKWKIIDNPDYIDGINTEIERLNKEKGTDFPLIENRSQAFYITEYLCYLFSDEIIFTNPNQKELMLNQFPVDVGDFVNEKAVIRMHPTFADEFYHIEESGISPDNDKINLAYFGNQYYGKRHFEGLFYALETLNHKFRDKIQLHIFISRQDFIKQLTEDLDVSDSIIIHKPVGYLEFLNATTKFDVLIVNDSLTMGRFEKNPYLPSKYSDYLGSGRDIWAIYEPGSVLSTLDVKYSSNGYDYDDCRNTLIEILEDHGYHDDEMSFNEYYIRRLTYLNELLDRTNAKLEKQEKKNRKLKKKNKKLKNEINEMKSSNSWKITKPLRNIRNR